MKLYLTEGGAWLIVERGGNGSYDAELSCQWEWGGGTGVFQFFPHTTHFRKMGRFFCSCEISTQLAIGRLSEEY